MAMQPARQYMTFEQYLLLVNNSGRRYEYHDGEVRLMAGGASNRATIVLNCGVALDQALGVDAVCRPSVTDKLVRVGPTNYLASHTYKKTNSYADDEEWPIMSACHAGLLVDNRTPVGSARLFMQSSSIIRTLVLLPRLLPLNTYSSVMPD
jgi:hypothetical protein